MPFWKSLFGTGRRDDDPAPAAGAEHKGFRITPAPIREGAQYRVAARIEKEVGGVLLSHELIRADTVAALDEARALSLAKARQMIDEQGERLFGPRAS
ncbi:MAG: HlyU family transcriptional regulator [Rhodobacteraceae bacterium]|nr:HlyU family transcriptional regulator [Paracoccaceae bacterium]